MLNGIRGAGGGEQCVIKADQGTPRNIYKKKPDGRTDTMDSFYNNNGEEEEEKTETAKSNV